MAFCSNCGKQLNDEAKFCFNCGAKVVSEAMNEPAASAPQQEAPMYQCAPQQGTATYANAPQQGAPMYQQAPQQGAPMYQQAPPQGNAAYASAPQQQAAPAYNGIPNQIVQQAQYQTNKSFSTVTVRYRCPNGDVFDGSEQLTVCPKCGAPIEKGGYIQMYRMGNFMGAAVGMGIYINDIPFGHIGNKQSIRINVPFGVYKIHVTHTSTRKCNDPVFSITPEAPRLWCKARFVKAGFAISVDQASPDEMPEF